MCRFLHILLIFVFYFIFPLLVLLIKFKVNLIFEYTVHVLPGCMKNIAFNVLLNSYKLFLKFLALSKLHITKKVPTSYAPNFIAISSSTYLIFMSHKVTVLHELLLPTIFLWNDSHLVGSFSGVLLFLNVTLIINVIRIWDAFTCRGVCGFWLVRDVKYLSTKSFGYSNLMPSF